MIPRPNVIVFLTDQQRWDCSGLHGNPLDLMPNFDRLARAGTHLRHSFTCQPLCAPARACLQTGLYATRAGVHVNQRHLAPDFRTLAHHFSAAGYRTNYVGKWHLAPAEYATAVPPEFRGGYDGWLAANLLELVSDAYDCRLWDGEGRERVLPGYRVDAVADAAIARAVPAEQPFFLFVSFLEPHHQNCRDDFPAPEGYEERYRDRWLPADLNALGNARARLHYAGYCGMVKRLDEALGRLCATLQERGLWENTVLLFTSDHGCHFKTRNGEYKRSCHESSIRVPTLFHGPGFMGGGERPELVSLIDLPPTLLEGAGLAVPAAMQGRSLLPRLREANQPWRDEVFIQLSETQNGRALRTTRWKYCVTVQGPDAEHARREPSWPVYSEEALYDLQRDPAELENLIGRESHAAVAAHLRRRLLVRIEEAEGLIPAITPGKPLV